MKTKALFAVLALLTAGPLFAQTQPSPAPATPPPAATAPTPVPAPPDAAVPVVVPPTDGKIRIYVTDEPIDEAEFIARHQSSSHYSGSVSGSFQNGTGSINGSSSGSSQSSGQAFGSADKGANPRTVEVQENFYRTCPALTVTDNPAMADYMLLFRRQGHVRSRFFALGGLTGSGAFIGCKGERRKRVQHEGRFGLCHAFVVGRGRNQGRVQAHPGAEPGSGGARQEIGASPANGRWTRMPRR